MHLKGITLPTLWLRLEDRKDFPLPLDDKSKAFLWQAVVSKEGFTFYKLKEPRPDLEKFDRFAYLCPSEGTYTEPVSRFLCFMLGIEMCRIVCVGV